MHKLILIFIVMMVLIGCEPVRVIPSVTTFTGVITRISTDSVIYKDVFVSGRVISLSFETPVAVGDTISVNEVTYMYGNKARDDREYELLSINGYKYNK